jgi:hypothetical protein
LGIRLARQAQEKEIPYLVVSGSKVVRTDDVRDLIVEYGAIDYFNKDRFDTKRFHAHIRTILFPAASAGPAEREAAAQPRAITIGFGEEAFLLRSDGAEVYVPRKLTALFACVARKVGNEAPGEEVALPELNEAVGENDSPGVASNRLRKAVNALNDHILRGLGTPPEGGSWVLSSRGCGYSLTTYWVRWVIERSSREKGLGRSSQSVYHLLIDPMKFQANTPDDDE